MNDHNATVIKQATPDDLEVLFSTCRQSYSENFKDHWEEGGLAWYLDKVYGKPVIKADLANPEINYFIVFVDQNPAGFMKLNLNSIPRGYKAKTGMEIEKLYFRLQYQGKGIGKKLIDITFDIARRRNKELIWLAVIDSNINAINFYKKMGFRMHDKTMLDAPFFKENLKGMWRMILLL